MTLFKIGVITCAVALSLLACSQDKAGNAVTGNSNSVNKGQNTPPPDMAATGRDLFKKNCAACHKESGKGGKMEFEGKSINPDDLTGDKIKHLSDQKLFEYITDGVPDEGMPSFKGKLKEPEIREIVKYIRAGLQKQEPD